MEVIISEPDMVSKGSKFAYSVGHVLNDLTASMWFSYLLVYYHRIVNFSNASAGYLLLIGQIADAISTTFVGFESDRTRTGLFHYGRRKSWHIIGVICVLCSFPFCFNLCVECKDSDLWAQFIYYTMFIIIFQFGWSCSQITHLAMINELTHKDDERVALNSYRYAWSVVSNIFVYTIASILLGFHPSNDETDITSVDAPIFRTLSFIVVGIGFICMIIFHVFLKESQQPAEETEHRLQLSLTSSGRLKRMTWIRFLREKQFYQCGFIWMCARIILNVTQVFLPLYIIDTISVLNRVYVAIAPLCCYLSGLLASFPMRAINKALGRKITIIFGLCFILASAILFWFIFDLKDHLQIEITLISACVLLGIGTSTTNICSFSLASDLIGLNTECGAFVYGIMSFADKLANGIVIATVQQWNPCTLASSTTCALYYRYILTFIPIGVAILTILMILSMWKTNIGGNRHELHKAINAEYNGTITFSDNKSNRAQFICVPPDASVTHVKKLMLRHWCKDKPSLVISITGGAKNYNMSGKLLRAFRRGLRKVATTTGAWIITGGMNTGIMKLVGDIVPTNPNNSRPIHIINCDQLLVHGRNVRYLEARSEEKGQAPLEPNHTEFIFINDGTKRKYGGEIVFRANLERAIAEGFFAPQPSPNLTDSLRCPSRSISTRPEPSDPVPVVLLVVEGGPNTVRTVHEAVVKNSIPAVFIQGTGRCCDLFAEALQVYDRCLAQPKHSAATKNTQPTTVQTNNDELRNKLQKALKDIISDISGESGAKSGKKAQKPAVELKQRESVTVDYFELVYECVVTRRNFLSVVSLNPRDPVEPDIDVAILKALLNATSSSESVTTCNNRKYEQFRLALEWKRPDIVKKLIMTDEEDWKNPLLTDLFEKALNRKQTDFVKLFLDHDFPLTNIFGSQSKLLLLYENSMKIPRSIKVLHDAPLFTIYKHIIQPLIGDLFDIDAALNTGKQASDTRLNIPALSSYCVPCGRNAQRESEAASEGIEIPPIENHSDCHIDVDKELFIWSVITNRHELNLLFWARCKNKICAALVAALVYRKYAHKNHDNRYYEKADEFEGWAVEILDRFHQSDPYICTEAIIRQTPAYGNVTWLDLAIKANAKQFIGHRAVQEVLNNIWFGYIDQEESGLMIILSTIMPWFSGFLHYHDKLVKVTEQQTLLENLLSTSDFLERTETPDSTHLSCREPDDVTSGLINDVTIKEPRPADPKHPGRFEKTTTRVKKYFGDIFKFLSAPYVKYLYSLYCHVAFLLLFTYLLLCDFFPLYDIPFDSCGVSHELENVADLKSVTKTQSNHNNETNIKTTAPYGLQKRGQPAVKEYILFVWVSTLLGEELRQLLTQESPSIYKKLTTYFSPFWNKLDVLAILLFYVGCVLRFLPSGEGFCAARIALSVDLTLWFIRSLDIFAAIRRLGPKLVMIGEMVNDLKSFMLILSIFIFGFGVCFHSLIYGTKIFSWHIPRDIINLAYWQMFGELNSLELFEKNYQANGYTLFILLVVYMTIVSVLLVNLLIAMLSYIFDRLHTNTDQIWKFQRYELICEYLSRPSLPPPLILLSHVWRLVLYTLLRCCRLHSLQEIYDQHTKRTTYKLKYNEQSASVIEKAEDAYADDYFNHSKLSEQLNEEREIDEEPINSPQEVVLKKIQILESQVQVIRDQVKATRDEQNQILNYLDCIMEGIKNMSGVDVRMPKRRHVEADDSIDDTFNNSYYSAYEVRRDSPVEQIHDSTPAFPYERS
ncbi:unnamed protein product [Rotaria socialis]